MNGQPSTSRKSVALATGFLLLSVIALGAVFYVLDGASAIQPIIDQVMALVSPQPSSSPVSNPGTQTAKLVLPAGMTQEFALRLWQEQVDSQAMIEKLVEGEVASLKIDKVKKSGDQASLSVTVKMKDGTSAPGILLFRRFGDEWFVASATGGRASTTGGQADSVSAGTGGSTQLPELGDVDLDLLSTILSEQLKSQSVIDEYLAGIVKEVFIEDVQGGPQTATMKVEMDETHGDGYAKLVAIQSASDGSPAWFLARFIKTGDATKTAQ